MARDRKNVFQLTPAQIRKKIREYKRTKANSRIETVGRRAKKPKSDVSEPMDTTENNALMDETTLDTWFLIKFVCFAMRCLMHETASQSFSCWEIRVESSIQIRFTVYYSTRSLNKLACWRGSTRFLIFDDFMELSKF